MSSMIASASQPCIGIFLIVLLSLWLGANKIPPTQIPTIYTTKNKMTAQHKIYDAIIVGGGPAGLSAALGLSRICRPSILFDSGEYRNQGSIAMHTYLSRDGIHPEEFRATARREIEGKYSNYASVVKSTIVSVKNTEILPGYKGFEAVDESNKTYFGRKLVLATGSEDMLPTDIEGYKENWASHMYVSHLRLFTLRAYRLL